MCVYVCACVCARVCVKLWFYVSLRTRTRTRTQNSVRGLTMGIKRGECFGMLGPNGAGKTTAINMLIGYSSSLTNSPSIMPARCCRRIDTLTRRPTDTHTFSPTNQRRLDTPTGGNAMLEGFSILNSMEKIYSIMGVCPQHDLLWPTLTAREHLAFYGALKNLKGGVCTCVCVCVFVCVCERVCE